MTDSNAPGAAENPAAQVPPTAPPAAPFPPYAAHLSGTAAAAPYASSPGYGAHPAPGHAQQLYPGAPPTWSPQAGVHAAPPSWPGPSRPGPSRPGPSPSGPPSSAPPPSGSTALAVIALVLSILGALTALVPFVGSIAAWFFLLPAIVLAIIALVRRSAGRGMAIGALVTSGVAIVVAALWGVGATALGSWVSTWSDDAVDDTDEYSDEYEYDDEYGYAVLGVEGTQGGTRADALAFGTTVTLFDENSGEDVWDMTVRAPEDITAAATEGLAAAPENGAYLAVAIELTNLGERTIDLYDQYELSPYTWLLTGDGGEATSGYAAVSDDYPALWEIEPVDPGETVTYYEVYDVASTVAETGSLVIDLESGQQVYWGAAPR